MLIETITGILFILFAFIGLICSLYFIENEKTSLITRIICAVLGIVGLGMIINGCSQTSSGNAYGRDTDAGEIYAGVVIFLLVIAAIILIVKAVQHENEMKAKAERQAKEAEERKKREYEENMAKIRAAGREEEFIKLRDAYYTAKNKYGMSLISTMGQQMYVDKLASSKKDPYIAGGIANGVTGSAIAGAATVITTELENQRIDQKLENEKAILNDKISKSQSNILPYQEALDNLNKLLIECGVTPLSN